MKRIALALVVCALAHGADTTALAETMEVPFEPALEQFFKHDDKFAHPPEMIAPEILFPFALRRGGGALTPAEVIVLVQLDGRGFAKKLKVLASRHPHFTRSVIEALQKARWDSTTQSWFYYRYVFTLDEKRPTTAPQPPPPGKVK